MGLERGPRKEKNRPRLIHEKETTQKPKLKHDINRKKGERQI